MREEQPALTDRIRRRIEALLDAADEAIAEQNWALVRQHAQAALDFAIEEFRAMKMQPYLERALRHKGHLRA